MPPSSSDPCKTSQARGIKGPYTLLCLGFSLCFSASPLSSVGTAVLLQNGAGLQDLPWARGLMLLAGAATMAVGAQTRAAGCRTGREYLVSLGLALVGAVAVLFGGHLAGLTPWNLAAYGILLGYGLGGLMPAWIRLFSSVYETHGRTACIVAFSCAFILSTGFAALVAPMNANLPFSAAMMVCVALGCWGCCTACLHLKAFEGSKPRSARRPKGRFVATRYTRAVLVSLGMTWALAYNLAPSLGFATRDAGVGSSLLMLLAYALCQAATVLVVWRAGIERTHFGLMLRWLIAIIGIGWSFMPPLISLAPRAACFVSVIVFLIQTVLVHLFVIELSLESGHSVTEVFSRLAMLFVGGACGASVLYWGLQEFVAPVRPDIVASLVAAVAIGASLLILPLLPSRGSNAQVFTLDRLPENEPVEIARMQARDAVVTSCGFTPREAEVLDCLLDGLPHDETAERLGISSWTVKNHTRSIYAKTGTHSVKELMALVYGEKGKR